MTSPIGVRYATTSFHQSAFDVQDMLKKAEVYANGNEDLLVYINDNTLVKGSEELLVYISDILTDKTFQNNPRDYLNAWKERRGNSKEYRMPEDEAREFFDANFKF